MLKMKMKKSARGIRSKKIDLKKMMDWDAKKCSYQYIWKHRTSGIDQHIFFLCSHGIKKRLDEIAKMLGSPKFPKKIYESFGGFYGETVTHYMENTSIMFVGYGKEGECDTERLYDLCRQVGKESDCNSNGNKSIMIHLVGGNEATFCSSDGRAKKVDDHHGNGNENGKGSKINIRKTQELLHHQVSGFILGHYRFDLLKSGSLKRSDSRSHPHQVYFYYPKASLKGEVERFITMSRVQNEVRALGNLPQNILNADRYIEYIRKAVPKNVKVRIMRNAELKKNGMNLILAVNQGSDIEAGLVILEYDGSKGRSGKSEKEDPIIFVGKGVIYDTGGYDIKTRGMADMKYDMLGSAIMYGVVKSHALLRTPGRFVALLPIVENLVSGRAYLSGDVIESRCGIQVEVTDTDAEGRLILADAICYACDKYKPKLIVDAGTLSGDAGYMFANKSALIMGNHHPSVMRIMETGMSLHEKVWELPMWAEYQDDLRSDVADIRSTGISGKAGAIIIGTFLANFVKKGTNWVHLDIAGVDYAKGSPYLHNGAKGEILQTLVLSSASLHR